jgi:two-component system, OmpR family, phosphate regulon sensor histidine kinase PhoR
VRLLTREVRLAQLKADFVSNLSHELKTPLTSIQIFTELLQDGQLTSEADRQEGLGVLAQESDRLQRIVKRMLDVARREARGVSYELQPGDLRTPVREAVERFRRIVTEPGLDLGLEMPDAPLPMRLDSAAVDDVVTNLVSNAWKYRRGDGARIRVRLVRQGRRAELTVADDGVGIPPAERRRVFEMFYRAEAYLTRSVAGTGLGLSLVRTIVRAHGGSIRCEEGEGGVGTRFRIRFPLPRRALEIPHAESAPTTRTTEAQATS